MGVWFGDKDQNGKNVIEYEGCVIDKFEHNGYDDSDFYAVVWDEDKQEVETVCYDTTRCGGYGYAKIDLTEQNLRKVYRYYYNQSREKFDKYYNEQQAKELHKGDLVKVVRGRKVEKGTVGEVFWIGKKYNRFSRQDELRVGMRVNDLATFIVADYVEKVDWENDLMHGKQRKRQIVEMTKQCLNGYCINYSPVFA